MFSVTLLALEIPHRTAVSDHQRQKSGDSGNYTTCCYRRIPVAVASASIIIYNPREEADGRTP
ncbi:MAG: hypothetical protein AUI12_03560 [Acidobacteria bacterium 13_2_20CM_2_57_6]|nr:MAG: hypothetical protein AUH16_10060 [Acidobacteria bacterium 13_2_20CM_57_7]OLB88954.1 MAG: hypothetical protein AUI12_03560 [Acidobacteria bacterium 13_2_20CM_2_57_6]PYT44584.1 MAG: hypothetical protein DMG47_10665 [Acidobacteriota bacterium]PYT57375.1 MAG: hypothetical protein DMG46_14440 [Acidobacteriota bacterium]